MIKSSLYLTQNDFLLTRASRPSSFAGLKMRKELAKDIGPPWYCEFSNDQRNLLKALKHTIHQDLVDRLPRRTRQALVDIGITCKLPRLTMLKAMDGSEEDPGIFIWNLYSLLFKQLPTELLPSKLEIE